MAEIGVAVVGFGLAGRVFHAPFVSAVPGLKLRGIVQRSGNEAATAYPGARVLRSFEEATASPDVDLVVVATPNETHYALARQALEVGKHVVIDKPFAGNAARRANWWTWRRGRAWCWCRSITGDGMAIF